MVIMDNIGLGLAFTLVWFLLLTGGVFLLLLMTYLLRRALPPKPVKIKENTESKEEVTEGDLELIAGVSAVIAALSRPVKTEHVREFLQPSTSLWKISSTLYSLRYEG